MRKKIFVILLLALGVCYLAKAQQANVAALLNQPNVFVAPNKFLAGMTIVGTGGSVQLQAPAVSGGVVYTLPGLPGSPGYALCIGASAGAIAYCPPPGGGAGVPVVNLLPGSLNFSTVVMNMHSAPQVVLIENTGTAPLVFGALPLSFTGMNANEFTQSTDCTNSLDAGWVCSVTVQMVPASVGPKGAYLNINDNATGTPQLITLTGTGG